MALQRIQNKYYASVSHDGGALEFLALLQAARQRFDQHLYFVNKPIDH
jgi:hypothetical protein